MRWFGGNFAPRGWAILEGQLLPVNQNPALFSILGTQYGGDGRTTFGLSDLRGRSLVGKGHGPGLSNRRIGEKGGEERHRLTVQEMPAHTHEARGANFKGTQEFPGGNLIGSSAVRKSQAFVPTTKRTTPLSPATIGVSGGNEFHQIMSPYAVLTPLMCSRGYFPLAIEYGVFPLFGGLVRSASSPMWKAEKLLSNFSKLALMVHKMAKFIRESSGLWVKLFMDRARIQEYDKNISFLLPRD